MIHKLEQQQSGFALLLTLIVVSVVLAIGLTLIDITLKQLVISSTNRDSEIAFHAAYAGAECAQYWRLQDLDDYSPNADWCMDQNADFLIDQYQTGPGGAPPEVHLSQYRIDWEINNVDRCTEVDLYIFDASSGSDVLYDIQEYQAGVQEECSGGNVCTFVLSRGYNRACSELNSLQTIQREVLLEF